MDVPVCISAVGRRYRRRVALDGVDLEVRAGEVIGLVGPNGSGKTTLLRIVAGFLRPDAGEARVLGLDPYREQARVMRRARFAFAPPALFETLTAREHLLHLGGLGGSGRPRTADVDGALETVGLLERADDRVRTFSFGMRQRLVLAQALLPVPELLVLDEPTDGLDPLAVIELRGLLRRLREEHGMAILLSSHLLGEVEELVDRLLVLSEGRELVAGAPDDLVDGRRVLRLASDDPVRARALLEERGLACRTVGDELELARDALRAGEAAALLSAAGLELTGYRTHAPSLEEVLIERLSAANGRGRR